jgi:hypothetical protein
MVPDKRYDTVIARLVKTVLDQLVSAANRSGLIQAHNPSIQSAVHRRYEWARRHLLHPKLTRAVRPLTEPELEQLAARARLAPLTAFVRLYQLLFERRDPKTIVATMESLVMAPRSTATLYELYVAFRLVNEFENLGMVRRRPWRLLGDTAPVAVLDGGTTTVVIHWQRSLQALAKRVPSLAQQVARANGLRVGPLRPDIVVEMKSGESVRYRFGEVKYYTRPSEGVATALLESLAYLKDAENLFRDDAAYPRGFAIVAGIEAQPHPAIITISSDRALHRVAAMLLETCGLTVAHGRHSE